VAKKIPQRISEIGAIHGKPFFKFDKKNFQ